MGIIIRAGTCGGDQACEHPRWNPTEDIVVALHAYEHPTIRVVTDKTDPRGGAAEVVAFLCMGAHRDHKDRAEKEVANVIHWFGCFVQGSK